MRAALCLAVALILPLAACAQDTPAVQEDVQTRNDLRQTVNQDVMSQEVMSQDVMSEASPLPPSPAIACKGLAQQGGLVICKTTSNAKVKIARSEDDFYYESANGEGLLFVGFDRDEKANFVEYGGERLSFDLTQRIYARRVKTHSGRVSKKENRLCV